MGKGLGKVIGYAFVIIVIIYLLYTPPVRHAFSDVKNLFSSGKDKVENFVSDNNEPKEPTYNQKAYRMPFPSNCSEIRKIHEVFKEAFGTGDLTIIDEHKIIGMNANRGPIIRQGRGFIGCEFIAIDNSKDQQGVFEIVVERKDDIQIPHRYLIHENPIRLEPTPERNLPNKK